MADASDRNRRERRENGSKETWKRVGWIAGTVVAVLAVAYLAAALVLQAVLDPETLSNWIEPRAEASLNRDVEIGGAEVTILPRLGLSMEDVEVGNLPDFEGPSVASVQELRLNVKLLPLFRRQVRIDEVTLERPVARLLVAPDGRTNFGDLVPEGEEMPDDEEQGPLDLSIRDVRISNGTLNYRDLAERRAIDLAGIEASGSVSRTEEGWDVEAAARAESTRLYFPEVAEDTISELSPEVELAGTAGPEFDWIEIETGELRHEETSLRITGRVDSLKSPGRPVDLRIFSESVGLDRIFASLPDSLRRELPEEARGSVGVDLRVTGRVGPESRPDVNGLVTLRQLGATDADGTELASDLSGDVRVAPDQIEIADVAGTLMGGSLEISGTVRPDSLRRFALDVRAAPRLDTWTRFAGMEEGSSAEGTLELDLRATGRMGDVESTELNGTADFSEVVLTHPSLGVPLSVPSGSVALEGRAASWSDLPLELGEDRLAFSGRADRITSFGAEGGEVPTLRGSLSGDHLQLDRIYERDPTDSLTYARLAFAALGDRLLGGRAPRDIARERGLSRPDSLPMAGEIDMAFGTVEYGPYTLEDASGRLVFAPTMIEITDAEFASFGGTFTGGLQLGLGSGAEQPFNLRLAAREVGAADFLATSSPLGRMITGALSLDFEAAGTVDSTFLPVSRTLAGSGSFTARDGQVRENPVSSALASFLSYPALADLGFTRWEMPFQIDEGTVRLAETSLGQGEEEVRFAGSVGLDGTLDLSAALEVPEEVSDQLSLEDAGVASSIVDRLTGGDGPMAIGVRVGGTTEDPEVGLEMDLLEGSLGGALRDELRQRLQDRQEDVQGRTRGLLDRFLPPRDSL